ncbi:MAG: BrnT family toxin [Longimicrobiales bacterium]
MDFEWDPEKREANLRERGFDCEFATLVFDGTTLERPGRRRDYGEARVAAIGIADDLALTVVYTDRTTKQGRLVPHHLGPKEQSP